MSLQVWLPLNGNLNNQGLSDLTMTNSGATVDSNGKIGSCYYCSSASYLYTNNFYLNTETFSVAYWVKYSTIGSWNTYIVSLNNSTSGDYQFMMGSLGGEDGNSSSTSLRINAAYSGRISIPKNEWHHCCATWQNNVVTIYVDGEKDSVFSGVTVNSGATHLNINCRSTSTSGAGHGVTGLSSVYVNDIRIYDHCLSAKEVKELSKGLICHYKLDNKGLGNPNLIEDSSFSADTTSSYVYRDSSRLFNGKPTLKISRSGATSLTYTGWARTVRNVKAGDTIYASAWVYTEDPSSIDYGCEWRVYQTHNDGTANNWSGWYSSSLFKKDTWVRVGRSYTLDTNLSSAVFNMNVVQNGTYWIAEPKVEYGTKPTTWCPHTSDSLYTSLGLNSLVESDCSGYRYNGTLSESLPYAPSSPRYDGCYYFNSTSKRITLPTINMSGFSNSFSIAWWGKAPSYSGLMYWGFSDGNRLNFYSGMYCNTGDGSSNPYYKPNTTTTVSTPSVDTWHHFVMVGDGSSNKLYMDGELYGVAKTYKGITGSTIVINGWDSSTSYKTNGYISDFRIYTTALSANDVKELYNTSASIDKSGNLYAYEFREE